MAQEARRYETIEAENVDGVFWITMNRPEVLNAVNATMGVEINQAFLEFDADDSALVAIIRGNGRAFCSGQDLKQRFSKSAEELKKAGSISAPGTDLEDIFFRSVNWKPIIAAVQGYAIGRGLHLALWADVTIAAEGCKFQVPETRHGSAGGSVLWGALRNAGGGRFATEVTMTGRVFTAEEALARGVINHVVPLDQLYTKAEEIARLITQNPPLAVRAIVRPSRKATEEVGRDVAYYANALKLHLTEDFRESGTAYREKRTPVFKGR